LILPSWSSGSTRFSR